MSSLISEYANISDKTKEINDKIRAATEKIASIQGECASDIPVRIEKLEQQLEKIDEYMLKVKAFQLLAEKNLESQNVLTIEAPPNYRVNLTRLRQWAMMIDPTASNDPYAQRVYVVAKCDECFLTQKKEEFTARIAQLKQDERTGLNRELKALQGQIATLEEQLGALVTQDEMVQFAAKVEAENSHYWYETSPQAYSNISQASSVISPGAYAVPLDVPKEYRSSMKAMFGKFYDVASSRVLLPVELSNVQEYVMSIVCAPAKRKNLDRALQNLVMATIENSPANMRKVYLLDAVRFSAVSLGSLRKLEGSFALEQIPRNPEQLTTTLENIVSSFADVDEIIDLHDSVAEYNATVDGTTRLPLSTVILFGWPLAYTGRDKELIHRMMMNYERYGVSFVTVTYQSEEKKNDEWQKAMPEYAAQNAIHIRLLQHDSSITFANSATQKFTWYSFLDTLSDEYVASLVEQSVTNNEIGNEYIKRYSLEDRPNYVREYKKIELPFGIDGKDEAHTVSFENENFATYLVGASRSGKSTLLHTLIAGLIRNYHPDNVELWLADFKQLEFKRYIKHCPPHVKYILLDESTELVYDLIDKLTAEMMERQKLFSRLGTQRIDQVDPMMLDKPLPVIFVILDEFSIMSQSIAESPVYKLRLQNILAKGAALGIKFLFSSQTFTTGVAGLTPTARAQIQQRISMKGSKEEISATLELSANLKTEQVQNWMDALPPHYALVKFRLGADSLPQVKRFLVMYFKDYQPRDVMIDEISANMHASETYKPNDIMSYTDKQPVLVDGNSYVGFDKAIFKTALNRQKKADATNLSGDEMFVSFGSPRLMVETKLSALSVETRENILLIARAVEQSCAVSIILSAIQSYQVQHGSVKIWAYEKNRMFRTYKQIFIDNGVEIVEGIDAICDDIRTTKNAVMNQKVANTLIVLIGMDRIYMDFDYMDNTTLRKTPKSAAKELIESVGKEEVIDFSEQEEKSRQFTLKWGTLKRQIKRQEKQKGKTAEEIDALLKKEKALLMVREGVSDELERQETQETQESLPLNLPNGSVDITPEQVEEVGAYNASEDFEYIVKQGSRLGYHFFLNLNAFADLKQCKLKLDLFRYKMAFQMSVEDSRSVFSDKGASALPEHICQFDDTLEKYSFRPYLHRGVGWDGWMMDQMNQVISPYAEKED